MFILVSVSTPINADPAPTASGTTQRWVLSVRPGFSPSDVTALGGTCLWYWQKAGIAAVDSSNPNFGYLAKGNTIDFAVADVEAKPPKRLSIPHTADSPPPAFDAYASGYQWYWQAIGAVRYDSSNQPVWQVGDYTGTGVKIADIDTGAPSVFLAYDSDGRPTAFDTHPEFNEYDPLHPELGGVVLLRDGGGNVLNYDDDGHGTAVCATLGAQHRGEGAMRGLAPKATLYCPKIDYGNWMSSSLEGWYKAAAFGCRIINNSWFDIDLPVDRFDDFQLKLPIIWRKAATALGRMGVLIVASATNDPIDPNRDGGTFYPWYYGTTWLNNRSGFSAFKLIPQDMPHVIIAGGTGPADYDSAAADRSVYDPAPGRPKGAAFNLDRIVNLCFPPEMGGPGWIGSAYGSFLTVVAPMGYNVKDWSISIRSFLDQLVYLSAPYEDIPGEGLHSYWGGTSFSAPITCGVAALAAEAYFRVHGVMPSPTTLAWIIKNSADDLVGPATEDYWVWNSKTLTFDFETDVPADKPAKDVRYGYGRVNAVKAIQLAQK